jgi:UDP-galactopyranose mutase
MANVTFVGRLATYKYYNMDQVVAQALTAFKRLQEKHAAAEAEAALVAVQHTASGSA